MVSRFLDDVRSFFRIERVHGPVVQHVSMEFSLVFVVVFTVRLETKILTRCWTAPNGSSAMSSKRNEILFCASGSQFGSVFFSHTIFPLIFTQTCLFHCFHNRLEKQLFLEKAKSASLRINLNSVFDAMETTSKASKNVQNTKFECRLTQAWSFGVFYVSWSSWNCRWKSTVKIVFLKNFIICLLRLILNGDCVQINSGL